MPLSVAGPVSPPVELHQLLGAWQLGNWTADVALGFQVLAAGLYLWGVHRLSARGRRWDPRRTLAFLGGLVVVCVAIESGLASYDDSVFTVHVIQHLLLMMLAPPLLSLGAPVTLALQASPRRVQTRIVRVLHSAPLAALTAPLVAGILFYSSMWVDMESSFYPLSLRHPLVHSASHLVLFSLGCLFWWPAVGADRLPRQVSPGIRLASLALGMPFESFLGIALMSSHQTIAMQHTLADVHSGGEVFWVGAMVVTTLPAGILAWRWLAAEERTTQREDRAVRQAGAPPAAPEAPDAWTAAWLARTGSVPATTSGAWRPPGPAVEDGATG